MNSTTERKDKIIRSNLTESDSEYMTESFSNIYSNNSHIDANLDADTNINHNTNNDNNVDTTDVVGEFVVNSDTVFKRRWEDANQRKVFVGNVPFDCTQEEFDQCFKEAGVKGICRAEIVKGHKDASRGIGFVTMDSYDSALELMNRKDIRCKTRILRFNPYQNNASKVSIDTLNNYVYVEGIPTDANLDREWLKKTFKRYGPFNRCFIAADHETGEKRSNGFLDVADDKKFESIISKKYHTAKVDDKTINLTTTRYRQKTITRNRYRRNARKEQLLSTVIIEEQRNNARERSGRYFRK